MLKQLELIGFKSFASKTRLSFDRGITAIVGPNGSGKSNIVDAIKWILGEQSAKSLRGGEMADVIFNGAAGQRPAGMAEATLTFDNAGRLLPMDCDEVQLTRRVFRNGEGEYLINKQPCRLKDIRDLLAGTGAGTIAYSVIEQGKVDVLLQASTKDRRAIFEEAAGISRFKARKNETLRKLDRTEQNLLRLADIIEEVEKQLRSVKYQAAKARRFQEHTRRLKELRVSLSLSDYHRLSTDHQQLQQAMEHLRGQVQQAATQTESLQAENSRCTAALQTIDASLRDADARLTERRARITTGENAIAMQRSRLAEARQRLRQCRLQTVGLRRRIAELRTVLGEAEKQLSGLTESTGRQQARIDEADGYLKRVTHELVGMGKALEQDRTSLTAASNAQARVQSELARLSSRLDMLAKERDQLIDRSEAIDGQRRALRDEVVEFNAIEESRLAQLMYRRHEARCLKAQRAAAEGQVSELASTLADLRERRSAIVSRLEVLDEMERRQEGLAAGVRQVLERVRQNASRWSGVLGVLADRIEADLHDASLADIALGPAAQYIVVEHQSALVDRRDELASDLNGQATFLCLDRLPFRDALDPTALQRYLGFRGIAVELVRCDAALRPAVDHLLGRTLIVDDLRTAKAMLADGHAYCYVTPAGDVLAPDGRLTIGPRAAGGGLISRKSELRQLHQQRRQVEEAVRQRAIDLQNAELKVQELSNRQHGTDQRINELADSVRQARGESRQRQTEIKRLANEITVNRREVTAIQAEIEQSQADRVRFQGELSQATADMTRLNARIDDAKQALSRLEAKRQKLQQSLYEQRVELAKTQERMAALQRSVDQQSSDLAERRQRLTDTLQQVQDSRARATDAELSILSEQDRVAHWHVRMEEARQEVRSLSRRRETHQQRLSELSEQVQAAQGQLRDFEEALHSRELELSEARMKRENLETRIRDDYQVELADMYAEYDPEAGVDGLAVTEEVAELRRKIAGLGSVNVEAIDQLEDLQARADQLNFQHKDLTDAKASLEEILGKINHDSRKLFADTFEAVRGHFQDLFRLLFGGGKADVILEDPDDILESGIEVIARPPGKEPQRISLLSGGEKTLTAVALLLAIFRSKPSPFCILDEVDAALDEANIGRFVAVLDEFVKHSQFIIVSHSKKTMASANVLYGVTMQESGISKKVSVRFEDVTEDGRITASEEQDSDPREPQAA